jgi:hypothetical protein
MAGRVEGGREGGGVREQFPTCLKLNLGLARLLLPLSAVGRAVVVVGEERRSRRVVERRDVLEGRCIVCRLGWFVGVCWRSRGGTEVRGRTRMGSAEE